MPSQPPDPYERNFNFTEFSQIYPLKQQPGQQIDIELNDVQQTVNQTVNRLNEIQNDDGSLRIPGTLPWYQEYLSGVSAAVSSAEQAAESAAAASESSASAGDHELNAYTSAQAAGASETAAAESAQEAGVQAAASSASADAAAQSAADADLSAQAAAASAASINPNDYIPQPAVAPVADQILGYDGTAWVAQDKSNPFNQDLNTTDSPSFVDLTLGSAESYAFKWISSGAEGGLYYENLPIVSIDGLGLQLLQSGMSVTFPDSTTQTTAFQASMLNPIAEKLTNTINWTGDYDNGVTYAAGDGVRFNGAYYVLKAGIGAAGYDPAGYPASWTTHIPAGLPALASTNTFAASQVIETTSTTAALRVTQLGTGNAFVVEDSANPDSSPFVITADGNVGIGRSPTAGYKLDVAGQMVVAAGNTSATFASGGTTITAVSTAVGLTITNTGTGNSFVVNDESGDTSPFIIDASGNVMVGTTSAGGKMTVVGRSYFTDATSAGGNPVLWARQQSASSTAIAFQVTNQGAGASLRVDDESTDTTPFIVDAGGNVGVKTASPSTDFEVNGNAKVTTLNIGSSGTISALSYETTGLAVHVNRSDFPNEIAIVIGGVTYRIPARQV